MATNSSTSYNGSQGNGTAANAPATAPTVTHNANMNLMNGQSHGFAINESSQARTLYVGNLDPQVNESLIFTLFTQIGEVSHFKMIHEPGSDPYCFVEFADHNSAANALLTMNKRLCLGRELKVNWAASATNAPKVDTSKYYHIFVGDLSPDVDSQLLQDSFTPFGEIGECRVVRDLQTNKSKGYGFVAFAKKADAENAIATMNGQWIGARAIRTNWATRKPPATRGANGTGDTGSLQNSLSSGAPVGPHMPSGKTLTYDEVYQQTSPTNCTVYCGGLMNGLTEELVQKTFYPFGPIQEIRVFKDKGYAFIKFMTKEAATSAICTLHNTELNGSVVKCSWGKESTNDSPGQAVAAAAAAASTMGAAQYAYPYHPQYWYPQQYSHLAAQAMAGQYAGMQTAGLAGLQTAYPYGQYYAASSPSHNYNTLMAWQAAAAAASIPQSSSVTTVAGQAQSGASAVSVQSAVTTAQAHQSAMAMQQQPQQIANSAASIMPGYSMQTYQTQ